MFICVHALVVYFILFYFILKKRSNAKWKGLLTKKMRICTRLRMDVFICVHALEVYFILFYFILFYFILF